MRFLTTVSKGLEDVLAAEARAAGLRVSSVSPGIVAFDGGWPDAWRANLWLRTARRVLWPVAEFGATKPEELYEGTRSAPWGRFLTPRTTFAVEASVRDSFTTHSGFTALKVKDAIADACRDALGSRPDVERRDPDLRVYAHIASNRCTISLDTSGGPLHKRGYRLRSVVAPLNETLAAGIVLLAGYDGTLPFCDPMCGSGTLLIEAALLASNTAPGLLRRAPFGFERWPGFDPKQWKALKEDAFASVRNPSAPIHGSDSSRDAVKATLENARDAVVSEFIQIEPKAISAFSPPPGPGIICTNPPYGEHLGGEASLEPVYSELGDALKHHAAGYSAFVLCGNLKLAKHIGLRPSWRKILYNGPMECRLLKFDLYEGSRKGGYKDEG